MSGMQTCWPTTRKLCARHLMCWVMFSRSAVKNCHKNERMLTDRVIKKKKKLEYLDTIGNKNLLEHDSTSLCLSASLNIKLVKPVSRSDFFFSWHATFLDLPPHLLPSALFNNSYTAIRGTDNLTHGRACRPCSLDKSSAASIKTIVSFKFRWLKIKKYDERLVYLHRNSRLIVIKMFFLEWWLSSNKQMQF